MAEPRRVMVGRIQKRNGQVESFSKTIAAAATWMSPERLAAEREALGL